MRIINKIVKQKKRKKMVLEIIGMVIGSSMIEDGKKDCRASRNLEKQDRDVEAEEYSTSGNLKKTSGFLLAAGSAISFAAEILGCKK